VSAGGTDPASPPGSRLRDSPHPQTGARPLASKKKPAKKQKSEGEKKVEIQDLPKDNQDQKGPTDEQAREVKGGGMEHQFRWRQTVSSTNTGMGGPAATRPLGRAVIRPDMEAARSNRGRGLCPRPPSHSRPPS
jgi:hypothetical protein